MMMKMKIKSLIDSPTNTSSSVQCSHKMTMTIVTGSGTFVNVVEYNNDSAKMMTTLKMM